MIFQIKYFSYIFLTVGIIGQKDFFKSLEKEITSELVDSIRSVYGEVPNVITSYNGTNIMHGRKLLIVVPVSGYDDYGKQFKKHYHVDDGNPDIHGKIERPCQAYDTFCIRKFFAEHSRCKISGRAVPNPVVRDQMTVNYPHTNMSATQLNLEYRGLNDGRVEEFYINKVSDNLVITLFFPATNSYSNETVLKFYLRGREPILTSGFGAVNPISFTITVIIPHLKDLRLDQAEITTFFNDPLLPFAVGPGLAISTDPEVEAMLADFLSTVALDQMEAGFTDTNFYAATFIQYNICDFGLKVI